MFADTVHNFSDALTALPLWMAFAVGRRAATRRYPYGLGRAEDLAGLFVVGVIAMSAAVAAVEAVHRLIHPAPLTHLSLVAAAGVVGFIGNELVAIYRIRVGTPIGSAALRADGLHARVDGLTSLAVVLGVGGVAAGFPAADPIVGLLIAIVIVGVLAVAARDVFRRLLDGVEPELIDTARAVLARQAGVRSVRGTVTGWDTTSLPTPNSTSIPGRAFAEAHRIAHDAEHALTHAMPKLAEAAVHAYPAHPRHCGQQLNFSPTSSGGGAAGFRHPNGSMPASLYRAAD